MRRILYDRTGAPQHYLTGAGVLYDLSHTPVGTLQETRLLNRQGRVVAWFDGAFAWDASGVLAFVKGAAPQDELTLPRPMPLRVKPAPTPAPMWPLLVRTKPPPLVWRWAAGTLADALTTSLGT